MRFDMLSMPFAMEFDVKLREPENVRENPEQNVTYLRILRLQPFRQLILAIVQTDTAGITCLDVLVFNKY